MTLLASNRSTIFERVFLTVLCATPNLAATSLWQSPSARSFNISFWRILRGLVSTDYEAPKVTLQVI